MMAVNVSAEPIRASRVASFASFFKSYMSVSAVVVASLPIPLTTLGAIPTFTSQSAYLATYTSLFCFLLLGFTFYSRKFLAVVFFGPSKALNGGSPFGEVVRVLASTFLQILPLLLIVGAALAAFRYHIILNDALVIARAESNLVVLVHKPGMSPQMAGEFARELKQIRAAQYSPSLFSVPADAARQAREILSSPEMPQDMPVGDLLKNVPLDRVPSAHSLMASHMAIFLLAEAAFILMAIREYLQDLLALPDRKVIAEAVEIDAPP
jgi:hypothetical protein